MLLLINILGKGRYPLPDSLPFMFIYASILSACRLSSGHEKPTRVLDDCLHHSMFLCVCDDRPSSGHEQSTGGAYVYLYCSMFLFVVTDLAVAMNKVQEVSMSTFINLCFSL